jgi:hypothetical protein
LNLLEFLASAGNGKEEEVVDATARVGRLVEILEAAKAAQYMEWWAHKASDDAERISELIVPKGRRGDIALNVWIADMMSIYKDITGRQARASVIPVGPAQGKPAGPFIRFLLAAIKPLTREGEPLRAESLRERIREIRALSVDQK